METIQELLNTTEDDSNKLIKLVFEELNLLVNKMKNTIDYDTRYIINNDIKNLIETWNK